MTSLLSAQHPAGRSLARRVFDVLVTVVAGATTLPNLYHDHGHPRPVAALALALVPLPLLVRRTRPIAVFAWLVLSATAIGIWDPRVVPGGALAVGLYTVAALRPRRDALVATAVLEVLTVAAAVGLAGGAWWYTSIFLTGLIGAALGLGLYTATRRAYLAELQDRAARLVRERDQQGKVAAAAERARIAHEMHDVVAHHLTVMVALSDGAVAASRASPEQAAEVMRSVSATGRRALADTRRLLGVLRTQDDVEPDGHLQPMPDLADLDVLVERVRSAGLATTMEVRGAPSDVPTGLQLTVYRLVQEALTNTLKHGGPNARASVRLDYRPDELRVEVDDDGAGASAPVSAGGGGGLIGMRERVHAYGGQVQAGPRRAGGWRVSARLRVDDGVRT